MKSAVIVSALLGLFAFSGSASANTCGATLPTKQKAVNDLCKPASKIQCGRQQERFTCAQFTALFEAAKACKAARVTVNKCFNPPDAGHIQAVAVVGQEVSNCQTMTQAKCAAEKRAAAAAAKAAAPAAAPAPAKTVR